MCIENLDYKLGFGKNRLLPPPNPLIKITNEEIIAKFKEKFPQANIYISDSYYMTTTLDELKRFLKSDDTNEYRYVAEFYDCDDFSFRLMGQIHCTEWGALSFGILWTLTPNGGHAVNVFVDDKLDVWITEPQNDFVTNLDPSWTPYLIVL